MSKNVRAIKINIDQIKDVQSIVATNRDFIVPKKATILSNKAGTLIQDESGAYFLVTMGDWFRASFRPLPQVDDFNQLQDLGLTEIKDKIVRNNTTNLVTNNGQEIPKQDNVSIKKINKTVAPNIKRKKEN